MGLLPAGWSEDLRLLVVILAAGVMVQLVLIAIARLAAGKSGKERAAAGGAKSEAVVPAGPALLEKGVRSVRARRPELDPDEWVSGNVIHLDRYRAVGLIRCDRVKSPVQFRLAPGPARVRVGQKVRFKGRHGARRRPVADVVERAG